MNEITKIDTKNGILSEGNIYHCLGKGSYELDDQAREILGVKALYRGEKEGLVADQRGCLYQDEYYLTTEQAEKWNAYIEEQDQLNKTDPLMERAIELAVDGIELLGYGRPEGYEIKEGYEYDYIDECWPELNVWQPHACGITNPRRILFQRKIKEESEPDLSTLTHNQLQSYHRDKWLELLTGNKPEDQFGSKNGTLSSVAKALYGKGGDQ